MPSYRFRRIAVAIATALIFNSVQPPVLAEGLNTLGGRLYNIGGLMRPAVVGRLAGILPIGQVPTEAEQRLREIEDTLKKLADGTLKLKVKEGFKDKFESLPSQRLNNLLGIMPDNQTIQNIKKLISENNRAGIVFGFAYCFLVSHMRNANQNARNFAFDYSNMENYEVVTSQLSAVPSPISSPIEHITAMPTREERPPLVEPTTTSD